MSRKSKNVLAISVVMLLLLAFMVPSAIANSNKDPERIGEEKVKESENVYDFDDFEQTGQEKIVKPPQLAWVRKGPITHDGWASESHYVSYGGCLSGSPVAVASLEIPWTYPYYSSQHHTVALEKGWVGPCGAYVHVTSEDGVSLTGSNINLIAIY